MKPVGNLIAERVLAQHCRELLGSALQPPDRKQAVAEWLGEACAALGEELRALLIGARTSASATAGGAQTAASLEQNLARAHIHYLVQSKDPLPRLVLSFDVATALALTDRLFGGAGSLTEEQAERLPQSCVVALERIARAMQRAIAASLPVEAGQCEISTHHNLARLEAFPRGDYCCHWTIELVQEGFGNAAFGLTALESGVHALIDGRCKAPAHQPLRASPAEAARRAPFDEIPLELRAELAQLQLPLSRLANFERGQLIALVPRREIPLMLEGRRIATGTIGTLDERVALRLARIS